MTKVSSKTVQVNWTFLPDVIKILKSNISHTAVKRENPTPLPVFAASNFEEFEKKTCETFVGKCYKSSTVTCVRENYKLRVSEDVCW